MSTCADMTQRAPRTRVSELHAHLVCVLCGGYYVDATTIVECLHTFCRSCIVRYLESSKFCPMCDVQVHKTRPLLNLRPDKTLQDLVYKVVPSSYSSEMQRRREYYNVLKDKGVEPPGIPPEDKGEPETPEFFSPEDSISLSLEYYTGEESGDEGESTPKEETAETMQEQEVKKERQNIHKRYLQCPAAVGMRHLKKFIRLKYDLSQDYKVDIIYEGECLREEFTLMDVAYSFTWKRTAAMRFYYRIYERPKIIPPVSETVSDRTISDNNDEPPVKRPRVLSSDGASTSAGTSTAPSTSVNSSDQKSSQPPAEPAEPISPPPTPAADVAEPVVAKQRVEKEGKRARSKSTDNKKAEPAPPPSRPKTPKIPKEKKESSTPRIVLASESKRDSSTQSTPKTISQPPKPIMPGQKPPSQTALLLQQRIIQQRQQQQQKLQLQKQQQQKLMMQKQQQMNSMHHKQIPSLNKLQPSLKQTQQMKLNRLNSTPSTVNKSPVSSSSQTTSKPVSVQTSSSSKQTPPVSKPAPVTSNASKSVPTTPVSKPNVSQATNKPVQPSVSNGKPVTSTPTTPKQAPVAETRKGENSFIEKEKRSPVVVIERHKKNGALGEKSSPAVHKDKSPPPATPKVPKSIPETTLTVAPGGSATKLRLVKRPATSPASSPPVAKKVATELPKASPPATLQPLEIKTSGEKPRHDDFGALDLSGKSSRKSDSPCSSHSSGAASPPAPSPPEPRTSPAPKVPLPQPPPPPPRPQNSSKSSKNQSPQTIMSIAQTLVNRQLSNLGFNSEGSRSPNSPHSQGSSSPSSQGSSGGSGLSFRNLMTLTDTAVQLRNNMQTTTSSPALQRTPTPQPRMRLPTPQQSMKPTYGRASNSSGNMRSPPPPSAAIRIPSVPNMNKTSPPKTTENGPMMSPTRVARLHDIFPGPAQTKPGPNQSVRHIPNPSLLFRQQANRMQQPQQQSCKDEITITPARNPSNPPLSSIRKIENLTRNIGEGKATTTGLGVRAAAEATQ